ncbi:MAG: hypothetical protein ACPLZD_10480 [Candidatus Saccharicenans sp.]|nr:hypothetical protein [Candidatus Aminicenantes bacterium]
MDIIIYEDSVKYDPGVKMVFWLPVVALAILATLFLLNYSGYYLIGRGSIKEAGEGGMVFLGMALFLALLFQVIFPKSLAVAQDGIVLKFKYFKWKVPFEKITSIEMAKGISQIRTYNLSLSFKGTVEIIKRSGMRIRITPAHPYEFLAQASRALEEWKRYHPVTIVP